MQDLGALGGNVSHAFAINALGQVVGNSFLDASGTTHAFLWASGTMQDLGTLGGNFSTARGINAAGKVIGFSLPASGAEHAVLWTTSSFRPLTLALTQVQLKPTAAEKVQMQGSFRLDAASDGINPASEPVSLELRKPDGTRVYPTATNPYGAITGFDVTTTGWRRSTPASGAGRVSRASTS